MTDDAELLRRYAGSGDESAFAELVRRHLGLVYHAALRQCGGDAHRAEDVAQAVFTDLARKAQKLAHHTVLAGWLYTSTRFAAAQAVRTELRRQAREREAHAMNEIVSEPAHDTDTAAEWERLRPVIDDALHALGERDREAVLLRFFEGCALAEVGAKLAVSEDAARMRIDRALEKMRTLLVRRGVTSTHAALAAALAHQAALAAPAGLATTVTGAALAGGGAVAGAAAVGGVIATFMSMTKLQVGITGALAVAGATGLALQSKETAALRGEVAVLRSETAGLVALRAENFELARTTAEIADLRRDDAELKRLSDEATVMKARLQQVAHAEQARAAAAASREVFDISRLDRTPSPRFQARPQYPAELRSAGIEGDVVVEFVVDANGDVRNARSIRSTLRGEKLVRRDDGARTDVGGAVVRMSEFTVAASGGGNATLNGVDAVQAKWLLEEAAVAAVDQWKFKAGQKGGRDVNTQLQMPIVFTLSDGKPLPNGPRIVAPQGATVFTPEGAAVIAPKP